MKQSKEVKEKRRPNRKHIAHDIQEEYDDEEQEEEMTDGPISERYSDQEDESAEEITSRGGGDRHGARSNKQ